MQSYDLYTVPTVPVSKDKEKQYSTKGFLQVNKPVAMK
jgi:hypothetical protein